ncbi:hypothetical protein TorRG33x02_020550 [Trema orientale]|uniref:Uncharacterized protein n=1 Tax=Trema orientale TaxID=63057 RepID=A0A2P5FWU0_TREOI|nr:hypothetical protein TorRG33x02_020550 [Trema orientale]
MLPFIELYREHDPTLSPKTECLTPFERSYVLQLVAIIVGTLTKTPKTLVTPTLRAVVDLSWESLCRLGMKLPVLEKLVATSEKPTALSEACESIQEAVKSWRAISDEVERMRTSLASKEEELRIKFDEEVEASKGLQNSQRLLLDEVEQMRKLVAAKEEEVQNHMRVFDEKVELFMTSFLS